MVSRFTFRVGIILLLAILPVAVRASGETVHQNCLQRLARFFADSVHAAGVTPTHSALREANYWQKAAEAAELQGTSREAIHAQVKDILSGQPTDDTAEVSPDRKASEATERALLETRVQPVAGLRGYEFTALWSSTNGPHIFGGNGEDGPTIFFNTNTGRINVLSLNNADNLATAFSGKRLLVSDPGEQVAILIDPGPDLGEELLRIHDRGRGPHIDFSPNGKLAAISKGETILIATCYGPFLIENWHGAKLRGDCVIL